MAMEARKSSSAIIRRLSMETYMVRIYTGPLSQECEFTSIEAEKVTPAEDVVRLAVKKLRLATPDDFELAEVFSSASQLCKERRLEGTENPVRIQLMWPKVINADFDKGHGLHTGYRFYIRKKNLENAHRTSSWMEYTDPNPVDNFLTAFLRQPTSNKEYSDLCNLPDLNERTLLENIKSRFLKSNIYTYVGSILIAVNPFKFFPIYNPKYVKMYQNKRLGDLPPHIFAVADGAFHTMLRTKHNQCIVISGESGSGKTESTNLLLHHLTALSHKGLHGSGVEQTILGAGPVLEAFGNAKTVHNNNSSRFGKFIQVNYKENGMVHGAIVEKYLLEKSRIVSQARNERNYHVFYYLLAGADDLEREKLYLGKPEDYFYLAQSDCFTLEEVDEENEFTRLRQSMEMVGFSQVTQKRIFGVLSAVLHLGNVEFKKKGEQHHDESVSVSNPDTIRIISNILKVKEKTLAEALTQKRATAGDETVVMKYKMEDAVQTRDAMAKCLYGALFDWIVLKVNQALLAKRHNSEHQGNSIGVLDIFGFEDFNRNSFEQFSINYANEHLQYYFNQHIFKFEQEEYKKEGIQWKNIEFIDNTGCLELFSKKPNGLFCLLDEECNFPGASNDTLLSKFHHHHSKGNVYYEAPQKKEMGFAVLHYAGKVKYLVKDFREKNSDQIRTDIVGNLKSSSLSFVRELMGVDPVAVLRWTIVKTLIKSVFAFIRAGEMYRKRGGREVVTPKRKPSADYLTIPEIHAKGDSFLRRKSSPNPDLSPRRRSPRTSPKTHLHDKTPSQHARTSKSKPASCTDDDNDEVFTRSPRHSGGPIKSPVDPYMSQDEAIVMRRATRVMMKNKSFKPKPRPQTMFSDIKTLKAIASRTMFGGGKMNTKKQSPSVSAQFQWSLSRLMATLNQANPFFIRCIKSNAAKGPCMFDDVLVLRQLRYTGMLATVRIRQSGYNYRLKFEEFIQQYKILLPKGLLSSKEDVRVFLQQKDLNQENFQIGNTKVFLREAEKLHLDESLHCDIMKRVIFIQRWMKTKFERKSYLQLRENTVVIQKCIRSFLARRKVDRFRNAAITIQKYFRGSLERKHFQLVRRSAVRIQAHVKGHIDRKRYRVLKLEREEQLRREEEEERSRLKQAEDLHSSTSDEGVLIKGSSAEDLDKDFTGIQRRDSEESSGILDDSESDTLSDVKSRGESVSTPPPTPTSPDIEVEGLSIPKDDYLNQSKQSSRVKDLSSKFQSGDTGYTDDLDGRSPSGTIYIRRGSQKKRPPKFAPAPLAKQESFSDLESPPTEPRVHGSISPEKLKMVEDVLKKPKAPMDTLEIQGDDTHSSPFKRVQKRVGKFIAQETLRETKSYPSSDSGTLGRKASYMSLTGSLLRRTKSSIKLLRDKSTGGRKKKDSTADDSEDESEHVQPKRPYNLGVAVLPHLTSGSLSPTSRDAPSTVSGHDVQEHEHKGIKKHRRTRNKDKERAPAADRKPSPQRSGWSVAKTSQWQYPDDFIITEVYEIQLLDEFINRKINGLVKDSGQKESIFDKVFQKAMKTFHHELKSTLSIQMSKGNKCNIKYRVLFSMFGETLVATMKEEKTDESFPQTLVMNAFRGFLDEFRNSVNQKKKEKKYNKKTYARRKQEKLKKDSIDYQGHKFNQVQFGIPTFCELCSNIIWIMEKGHVCQVCKYTCHRKCIYKSSTPCKGVEGYQKNAGTRVFGIPLSSLVSENDKVPEFMENIIKEIEMNGLYTEGIYRKSGAAQKVNKLKLALDSGLREPSVDDYSIHVLTTTLKSFFRELPEPLLTFELFDEFLQAADIQDEKETVQVLFSIVEKLPKSNFDCFERLVFHLARVAMHESSNKMSVNGLAIIFAPCLLRTDKAIQAQDCLDQVPRQTLCIEKILQEQLFNLRIRLQDINTLESAEVTASVRLSEVRASMRNTNLKPNTPVSMATPVLEEGETLDQQEAALSSHILSIRQEKDEITSTLPVLEYRHSSDDEMLSMDDMESTYDTADDMEEVREELSFDLPASPPSDLRHLTKRRASAPQGKRPPSQYSMGCYGNRDKGKKRLNPSCSSDDLSDPIDSCSIASTSSTDVKHSSTSPKSPTSPKPVSVQLPAKAINIPARSKGQTNGSSEHWKSKLMSKSQEPLPGPGAEKTKSHDSRSRLQGTAPVSGQHRSRSKENRNSLELMNEQLDIRVEGVPGDSNYLTVSGFGEDEDEIMV